MRTIDPAIILAAMATLETPPVTPMASLAATSRVASRPRRVTFAPTQPLAVSVTAN